MITPVTSEGWHTHGELAATSFIYTFYLLLSVHSSPTFIPGLLFFHLLSFRSCQQVSKPTHISILIIFTAKLTHKHTHIQNHGHPTERPTTNHANKFCSQNWETLPEILVNTAQQLLFHISQQGKLTQEIATEPIPLYHLSFGMC